jgi:biopolymer transport protein TolR
MQYRNKRKQLMSEINVVPYIDVMLVLLVIFMITAPLLTQGVKVELPQARAETVDVQRAETLVVTVDRNGRYFLNDKPLSSAVLAERVAAAMRKNKESSVLVRGDREVDYGSVVRLMALLQDAGAPNVGLLTENPEAR